MHGNLNHSIEIADDAATLYLSGALRAEHAATLIPLCIVIPPRVTTLRIDLHGIANMADDGMDAIRAVLRFWRESRNGNFRLSVATERIVATHGEGRFATMHAPAAEAMPALTGMYL